jgi:hypothetical protein
MSSVFTWRMHGGLPLELLADAHLMDDPQSFLLLALARLNSLPLRNVAELHEGYNIGFVVVDEVHVLENLDRQGANSSLASMPQSPLAGVG